MTNRDLFRDDKVAIIATKKANKVHYKEKTLKNSFQN